MKRKNFYLIIDGESLDGPFMSEEAAKNGADDHEGIDYEILTVIAQGTTSPRIVWEKVK